ncbi:MAG: flagellar basal body L-ring protein FlgH [Mariprofundaceae bacterium]|nr:flagellar basal body L-ring protein FlgH [Mariprofundaceae bacterium]
MKLTTSRCIPSVINHSLLLAGAMLLAACMPTAYSVTHDKHAGEVEQSLNQELPDASKTGSLWSGNRGMFTDAKAGQVGDLLTILVSESTNATRSLGTKKNRSSAQSTQLNALLGYETSLSSQNVNFVPGAALDVANSKTFDGSGSTKNSDTLTASVTAVATKVYPNGNIRVRGRRQVTINQQPQELAFEGVVRPNDIAPDNTISSSKVAQAIISYGGGGELASVAHEGWAGRTLDQIWPF